MCTIYIFIFHAEIIYFAIVNTIHTEYSISKAPLIFKNH